MTVPSTEDTDTVDTDLLIVAQGSQARVQSRTISGKVVKEGGKETFAHSSLKPLRNPWMYRLHSQVVPPA